MVDDVRDMAGRAYADRVGARALTEPVRTTDVPDWHRGYSPGPLDRTRTLSRGAGRREDSGGERVRVLVVAAHPDDEVLGCGATVARLVSEGHDVAISILGEGATSRRRRPAGR